MAHAVSTLHAPLHEIVDLPAASPPANIADAIEERFQALFSHASRGDPVAQGELVRLRLAYLNWAYAGQGWKFPAHPSLS